MLSEYAVTEAPSEQLQFVSRTIVLGFNFFSYAKLREKSVKYHVHNILCNNFHVFAVAHSNWMQPNVYMIFCEVLYCKALLHIGSEYKLTIWNCWKKVPLGAKVHVHKLFLILTFASQHQTDDALFSCRIE